MTQNIQAGQTGEDPGALTAVAKATEDLKALLDQHNLEVDYVGADWRDTESLIEESHKVILRHPGWGLHYINGDNLGIDANYVFFTSKLVDDDVVMKIAHLIVGEGGELPQPFMPECPGCGEGLDSLIGCYPASVPAEATIINGVLIIDLVDGLKITDVITDKVESWHCPNCEKELFKADEEGKMTSFLKGEEG